MWGARKNFIFCNIHLDVQVLSIHRALARHHAHDCVFVLCHEIWAHFNFPTRSLVWFDGESQLMKSQPEEQEKGKEEEKERANIVACGER